MRWSVLFFILLGQAVSNAQQKMSLPVTEAHNVAAKSRVRNLFMFNYAYYSLGLCKDQDCSPQKIKTEMEIAKQKMGADFPVEIQNVNHYGQAIKYLQTRHKRGDLATLSSYRTTADIFNAGIFTTCVDFSKAVMDRAIRHGYPAQYLGFFVMMIKSDYLKMCPKRDGQAPILPRPIVHTLVAYWQNGQWFGINVENPKLDVINLGPRLPNRLSREHVFTFPKLIANQNLVYAGTYDPKYFVNGYPLDWLISITASGYFQNDLKQVRCL
jgi:hypothetical protein